MFKENISKIMHSSLSNDLKNPVLKHDTSPSQLSIRGPK
jgi:hypothetical protein